MNNQELDNILKTLKALPEGNDEMARAVLKAASDSITLETLQKLLPTAQAATTQPGAERERGRSSKVGFTFTKKEMKLIPTMYKKIFACNNQIIPYRYHKGVYEPTDNGDGSMRIAVTRQDTYTIRVTYEGASSSSQCTIKITASSPTV